MITDAMIEAAWNALYIRPVGPYNIRTVVVNAPSKDDLRVTLEAALSAMWRPIETHGKGEDRFLAYEMGHEPDVYECWWDDAMNDWQSDFGSGLEPSHWAPLFRPLPSLPEKSE